MFAASLDLVNWLHKEKKKDLYESASAEREREKGRGRCKDRKRKRKVKERKNSVFTDPISGVPQWCGFQTNPEHYLPYV